MSAAGGLHKALLRGHEIGCQTVQLFTRNPNQWQASPLKEEQVECFKAVRQELGFALIVAHDGYLINLASATEDLHRKSLAAFRDELERAESLGITYLVAHPGAHRDRGEEAGLKRVAESLNRLQGETPGYRVKVLLETTAGQGTSLGYRFEHLQAIMDQLEQPERVAVCFDSCHVFAAGYDLHDPLACQRTLEEFERVLGVEQIALVHVNDSKGALGSRIDRHAHIGQGAIGKEGLRCLLRDPRLQDCAMILETPQADKMNGVNLQRLFELAGQDDEFKS